MARNSHEREPQRTQRIDPNRPAELPREQPRFVDPLAIADLGATNCSWWNGLWPCDSFDVEAEEDGEELDPRAKRLDLTPDVDVGLQELVARFTSEGRITTLPALSRAESDAAPSVRISSSSLPSSSPSL